MLQLQFLLHSFQYTEFLVRVFINTATTVCLNLVALVQTFVLDQTHFCVCVKYLKAKTKAKKN